MRNFKVEVRKGDPLHRAVSNDGWEEVSDVWGTEAQALEVLQDYQCGRRTIITASTDNVFRLNPVRPINLTASRST
jgi:hypothetical protein